MNSNSTQKQNRPIEEPLFKTDPDTGKLILLPRKWFYPDSSKVKSSEKKVKRTLKLAPLVITDADFEEPPIRSSKIRKVDNNSARKELFNIPSKGSQISRPLNTRRTLSRRSVTSQKISQKKFKPSELSPLLDMEQVEEELINNKGFLQGYPFTTPSKPAVKFTEDLKVTSFKGQIVSDNKNIPKIEITEMTPDSLSSNESEFLQLEKICAEDPEQRSECNKSPISSVCNLLEGTVINSNRKEKKNLLGSMKNIQESSINDIEHMLIEYTTAFEQYKTSHERNISKITELLETDRKQYENLVTLQDKNKNLITGILQKLKYADQMDHTDVNKENTPINNRRSLRLLNKSPRQTQNAKLVVSPAVLKSRDLRKTTLTKNLVTKTQQYGIESPRIKKALDMYNSMRCEISVLATPKFERNYLNESPKSTNLSRNLSRRVQSQCLLLQDTPIHK